MCKSLSGRGVTLTYSTFGKVKVNKLYYTLEKWLNEKGAYDGSEYGSLMSWGQGRRLANQGTGVRSLHQGG